MITLSHSLNHYTFHIAATVVRKKAHILIARRIMCVVVVCNNTSLIQPLKIFTTQPLGIFIPIFFNEREKKIVMGKEFVEWN